MRDLDMSDVLADARAMEEDYYTRMWYDFDRQTDAELQQARYARGPEAREG